jgi:hypothetical protein
MSSLGNTAMSGPAPRRVACVSLARLWAQCFSKQAEASRQKSLQRRPDQPNAESYPTARLGPWP